MFRKLGYQSSDSYKYMYEVVLFYEQRAFEVKRIVLTRLKLFGEISN